MKQTIYYIARCIAWGVIETISYFARHPELVVFFLIGILMLKLSHAICMSIIYQ